MTATHGSPIALTIAAHSGNLLGGSSWGFWPDPRHILYRRNTRNAERQQQCGRARQQGSSRVRMVQALDSRRSAVPIPIQQRGGLREARPFPSRPTLLTLTNTTTARRSRNSEPNDTRLPDASSTGRSATAAARGCPGSVSEPVGIRTGPAQPLTCRVTGAAIMGVGRPLGSARAQRDGAGPRLGSPSTTAEARSRECRGASSQGAEPRGTGRILRRRGHGGRGGATGAGAGRRTNL